MRGWSVVAGLVALCTSGCSQQALQPQFTAEDEAAIQTLLDQWEANTLDGRFIANLGFLTDDAVEMLATPRVGLDEIRTRWEGFVDRYDYTAIHMELRELLGFGDYAFAWVQYEQNYLYDGSPRVGHGTMSLLLQRGDDGAWKICRSAWMGASVADTTATGSTADTR